MTVEDVLRTARDSIGQMPKTDVQSKFAEIQARRRNRDQPKLRRQEEEFDALLLDESAYQAAVISEAKGDLRQAARLYLAAALSDFANAPLRLAIVLDTLASEYLTAQDGQTAKELALVQRALWWYAKAFAAGEIEAAELIERLSMRHDPDARWTQATPEIGAADYLFWARADADMDVDRLCPIAEQETECSVEPCTIGGLGNLVKLGLPERLKHFRSCQRCRAELAELKVTLPDRVPAQR